MHKIIFTFIFLILLISASFGQMVLPDTTEFKFKEEEIIENDSTNNVKYVPDDMIFIPSDLLYNHNWDNINIRKKKIDISTRKDTTIIFFNNSVANTFIMPYKGKLLSPFGYRGRHFHTGLDIKLKHNDTVVSAMGGKVRLAKPYRGYGNTVVIRHYNGLETVYSHLAKICVMPNQDILAGELVGLGGRTGRATTDHLHFEVRFLDCPINPLRFIDLDKFVIKNDTLILTNNSLQDLTKSDRNKAKKSKKGKNKKSANQNIVEQNNGSANKIVHKVKNGDTLSQIASKHGTTVDKICKLNNISRTKMLKLGMNLKIK